jgi:hypothetical protein
LEIRSSNATALDAVHEIGHFLDYAAMGTRNQFASESTQARRAAGDEQASEAERIQEFMKEFGYDEREARAALARANGSPGCRQEE